MPLILICRSFESYLGLRFFLFPPKVDSLHLPLFSFIYKYQWHRLVGWRLLSETFLTINVTV